MYLSMVYHSRATEDDKFLFEIALCNNGYKVKEVNFRCSPEVITGDRGHFCSRAYEHLREVSLESIDELVKRAGYSLEGIDSLDKFIAYFTDTSVAKDKHLCQYKGVMRKKETTEKYIREIYEESRTYYKQLIKSELMALYARTPKLIAGVKRRFITHSPKYLNLVKENPAIFLNIENDFVDWVRKSCRIDNLDLYSGIIDIEKIIGKQMDYFFSYWCNKRLNDYIDASQMIVVNGDLVSASDMRNIEVKAKINANIYKLMANINEVNLSLFYHSSAGVKEPLYYTIVEWYVSRALQPKVDLINSSYDKFKSGVTEGAKLLKPKQSASIFKLEKNYGINRPTQVDYEFKQKINNNIRTLEEAYRVYQSLTTKNFLSMIVQFAWNVEIVKAGMRRSSGCLNDAYFREGRDYIQRSLDEPPAIKAKNDYLYGPGQILLTDEGISHAKKLMNCFNDLKTLEELLAGYGLTLVDLPIARVFSYEEYNSSISIEGVLAKSLFRMSDTLDKTMTDDTDAMVLDISSYTDYIVHQYDRKQASEPEDLESFSFDDDSEETVVEEDSLEKLLPGIVKEMPISKIKKYALLLRKMGAEFVKNDRSYYEVESIEKSAWEICILSRKNIVMPDILDVIALLAWYSITDDKCKSMLAKLIGASEETIDGIVKVIGNRVKSFESVCASAVWVEDRSISVILSQIRSILEGSYRFVIADYRILYDGKDSHYEHLTSEGEIVKTDVLLRDKQNDLLLTAYRGCGDYERSVKGYMANEQSVIKAYTPFLLGERGVIRLSFTVFQVRIFNYLFSECKELFSGKSDEQYENNDYILSDRILNAEIAYNYCGELRRRVFDSIVAPIYLMNKQPDAKFSVIYKANIVKNIDVLDSQITKINQVLEFSSANDTNIDSVVAEMEDAGITPILNLKDYTSSRLFSVQMVNELQRNVQRYINGNLLKNLNVMRARVSKFEYEIQRDIGFGRTLNKRAVDNGEVVHGLIYSVREFFKQPETMPRIIGLSLNASNKRELERYKPYTVGEEGLLIAEDGSYYLGMGRAVIEDVEEPIYYLLHEAGVVISIVNDKVSVRGLSEERSNLFDGSGIF